MAAVPLACVALLPSCSFDDDYDGGAQGGKGPVAVKLSVTAGEPGDLNGTRAAGDLVEGGDGEFMHTLRVYIVKLDAEPVTTVLDLSDEIAADFAQNPLAESGNVKRWNFDDLSLAPGRYAVYAFANIEDYSGVFDSPTSNGTQTATGKEMLENTFTENNELRDDNLNSYRLTNPAGAIDLAKGKFIPMSARYEFTVSGDLNESGETVFSIGLDRLVTKVKMTINDAAENIPANSTITFGNYSENVPLMGNDDNEKVDDFTTYFGERTKSTTIKNVNSGDVLTFYVNETLDGAEKPFTVTLSTENSSGVSTYTATTECTELPRNSIYPLTLTFSDFGISITPRAWLKVTAVPYDVYYKPVEDGVYRVELATGSYFELTPKAITAGDANATISGVTWEWTQDGNLPTGYVVKIDGNTVTGNLPAGGTSYYGKFTLKLNGKWKYDGADYDRTYTFIIDVCHDEVWAMDHLIDNGANSRAAEMPAPAYRLAPEYLNMFKVK